MSATSIRLGAGWNRSNSVVSTPIPIPIPAPNPAEFPESGRAERRSARESVDESAYDGWPWPCSLGRCSAPDDKSHYPITPEIRSDVKAGRDGDLRILTDYPPLHFRTCTSCCRSLRGRMRRRRRMRDAPDTVRRRVVPRGRARSRGRLVHPSASICGFRSRSERVEEGLTRIYLPSGLHARHVNAPKYDW